jgi:hypothetical protein
VQDAIHPGPLTGDPHAAVSVPPYHASPATAHIALQTNFLSVQHLQRCFQQIRALSINTLSDISSLIPHEPDFPTPNPVDSSARAPRLIPRVRALGPEATPGRLGAWRN